MAKQPDYAQKAMELWHEWDTSKREYGWEGRSSLTAATESVQAQTRTDGIAKWRGKGPPPPMPKETRRSTGSVIPRFDQSILGPEVDRHLQDLAAIHNRAVTAEVMKEAARHHKLPYSSIASDMGISERKFKEHLGAGRLWLLARLTAVKRDW